MPGPLGLGNCPRHEESRRLVENAAGLDMFDQVLWQPPGRFELSQAEEFFRLVAIMS